MDNRTYKPHSKRIHHATGFDLHEMQERVAAAAPRTDTPKLFAALYGNRSDRDHLSSEFQFGCLADQTFDSVADAQQWLSDHGPSFGREFADDSSIEIHYVRIVSTLPDEPYVDGTSNPFPSLDERFTPVDPWQWVKIAPARITRSTTWWSPCHHPGDQVGRGRNLVFCRACDTRLLPGGYLSLPLPPNVRAEQTCSKRQCDGWATAALFERHVPDRDLCGLADTSYLRGSGLFCLQHAESEIADIPTPQQLLEMGIDVERCRAHGKQVETFVDFAPVSDVEAQQ